MESGTGRISLNLGSHSLLPLYRNGLYEKNRSQADYVANTRGRGTFQNQSSVL